MKILEVCHFSAGTCGVWSRAKEESIRLASRGHEVKVFSSCFIKGTKEIAPSKEKIGNIEITRFPASHLGGESFMRWSYTQQALDFKPDVIIVHNYRQLHTTSALSIAKKLRRQGHPVKVFLVTHAPFVEGNITRSRFATLVVKLYDSIIGPRTLNKFDGVIVISHWEIPFLIRMGLKNERIHYIPNGIPEEFFTQKKAKEQRKILFLGRIAPKKKLETLIEASRYMKDKKVPIEIVGPPEKEYLGMLKQLISQFKLENIKFSPPVYDLKKKIQKIDSASIYVLPSRVEGMPQSLIEAMARKKIVIGSNSMAIRDLIINNHNGYLFEFDNPKDLAKTLDKALSGKSQKIKINAERFVRQFKWETIVDKIENLIS